MEIKRKALVFELKADTGARTIEGYASVFGVVDLQGDRVVKGAFMRSLKEHKAAGRTVPLLYQHDTARPIGVPLVMLEDARGLFFKDFISKTALGDEVLELVADGVVTGVSIGYAARDFRMVASTKSGEPDVRELLDVQLLEKSIVTFPANEDARVTRVVKQMAKGENPFGDDEEEEDEDEDEKQSEPHSGTESVSDMLVAILQSALGNRDDLELRMAEAAGISQEAIQDIISGRTACPPTAQVERISEALGIDAAALLAAGARGGCPYVVEEVRAAEPEGEEKAGRVLRSSNLKKLREARKALKGVMQVLTDVMSSDSRGRNDDSEDEDEGSDKSSGLTAEIQSLDEWLNETER